MRKTEHSKNDRMPDESQKGTGIMILVYSGTDIGFLDLAYNIEGECHRLNIETRLYPDKRTLLAGNAIVVHRNHKDSIGVRQADYIGDKYETILD